MGTDKNFLHGHEYKRTFAWLAIMALCACLLLFVGVDHYLLDNAGFKFIASGFIYLVPAGWDKLVLIVLLYTAVFKFLSWIYGEDIWANRFKNL